MARQNQLSRVARHRKYTVELRGDRKLDVICTMPGCFPSRKPSTDLLNTLKSGIPPAKCPNRIQAHA